MTTGDIPDTIAAVATAVGGPLAVVRISGPAALAVGEAVWRGRRPLGQGPARLVRRGHVVAADGTAIDDALAVYFPAPGSYTGEPVVEISCHGGSLGTRLVLARVLACGARGAEPGEFTKRAFLNGKLDLTQAEAVVEVIEAHSEMALRVAERQLRGRLGERLNAVHDRLLTTQAEVESRLDFPEEELEWLPAEELDQVLVTCQEDVAALLRQRRTGELLRAGLRVVIAGSPNVGKSSLLNAILGRDRAIVTHLPGTTRDTLEEWVQIRGLPVRLVDTAGIRATDDLAESLGVERSWHSIREADVVLWVVDASLGYAEQACPAELAKRGTVVVVANKRDLRREPWPVLPVDLPVVLTCALTREGFEDLFDVIERLARRSAPPGEPEVAVSVRHAALLDAVARHLGDARHLLQRGAWELCAVALRDAIGDLGRITGRTVAPDVLEAIFSRFCIGK